MEIRKRTNTNELLEKSIGAKFVVSGLTSMVEDEGYHPRELFDIIKDVQQDTFFALLEIYNESHGNKPNNNK